MFLYTRQFRCQRKEKTLNSVASDGTGSNGLYTQELLKYIQLPDLSIEQVFKQVRIAVRSQTQSKQIPWESSSLEGDFYFSVPASASSGTMNNPPATVDPAPAELSFWETIKNSNNRDDFKAYLREYPNGRFASLAKIRANPDPQQLAAELQGKWEGVLKPADNLSLRVVLRISKTTDGRYIGRLISPDQDSNEFSIDKLTLTNRVLRLEIKTIDSVYEGRINEAGTEISGNWKQAGQSWPLIFRRATQ